MGETINESRDNARGAVFRRRCFKIIGGFFVRGFFFFFLFFLFPLGEGCAGLCNPETWVCTATGLLTLRRERERTVYRNRITGRIKAQFSNIGEFIYTGRIKGTTRFLFLSNATGCPLFLSPYSLTGLIKTRENCLLARKTPS